MKQTTIPFKDIRSLFNNPIIFKGRSTFSIEYMNSDKEISSIKFNINYENKKISNFIGEVKKINHKVEIV